MKKGEKLQRYLRLSGPSQRTYKVDLRFWSWKTGTQISMIGANGGRWVQEKKESGNYWRFEYRADMVMLTV